MKICQDSATIKGCGVEKPLSGFPKAKYGHQAVCKCCIADHRRRHDREIKVDPEAALFNMANIAWR